MIIKFNKIYFLLTILIFIIEILIALYVHDGIVRPYIGDLLVVILIYCFIKSFIDSPIRETCLAVLIFSFVIEALQYLKIVELIGLGGSKLARIIIGTSFAWEDLLAYTAGIILVYGTELLFMKKKQNRIEN